MLDRKLNQTGEIGEIQLLHHPVTISFYGFNREVKVAGNLRAGFTFDDQLQDLPFPAAETIQGVFNSVKGLAGEFPPHRL